MNSVIATNGGEIGPMNEMVHDALFDPSTIACTGAVLSLTFFQQERSEQRRTGAVWRLRRTVLVPLRELHLTISDVVSYDVKDDPGIGLVEVEQLRVPSPKIVEIVTNTGLVVSISVSNLRLELATGGLAAVQRSVTDWFGGLIESAGPIV